MKKDENAFIKVLIILVIASLALLAIVYLMMKADKEVSQDPIAYPPVKNLPIEFFDNLGRLVVNEDIRYADIGYADTAGWQEKCEGSEWKKGELFGKTYTYTNLKYGYSLDVVYKPFYNDDLIVYPFSNDPYADTFQYNATVIEDEEGNYKLPCELQSPVPDFSLGVQEAKTVSEIKEDVMANNMEEFDYEFQEIKIGNWDTVSYHVTGYMDYYHIILLGEKNNYHFTANEGNEEQFLDMVKSFELLSEEKTTKKLDDLLTVGEARNMVDVNFEALCEGSDWVFGEKKEDWFYNEKYGYKVKYKYQEFYNDDLKQFPYSITSDSRSLIVYPPRFLGNEEEGYSYPCQPIGGGDYMRVTVKEVQSPEKILEEVKEGMSFNPEFNIDFQEVTFDNGWEAVTYKTSGYGPLYHNVVLLGDDYNYYFFAPGWRYDELLDMVKSFELLSN